MRQRSIIGLVVGLVIGLVDADAAGRSCISHAYEHFEVERIRVRVDGVDGDPEGALPGLRDAFNSGYGGRWLLVEGPGWGRFFSLAEAYTPTASQAAYIEGASTRILSTECGYGAMYTPILPGRYVHAEDHVGDAAALPGDAELLVAADRQTIGLRYRVGGHLHEIEYRVACARFDWKHGGERDPCGPREEPTPLFSDALASGSTSAVGREPPRIEAPTPAPLETPRGCAITRSGEPILGLALALFVLHDLARRRRGR